jgi:hypothetical protein
VPAVLVATFLRRLLVKEAHSSAASFSVRRKSLFLNAFLTPTDWINSRN